MSSPDKKKPCPTCGARTGKVSWSADGHCITCARDQILGEAGDTPLLDELGLTKAAKKFWAEKPQPNKELDQHSFVEGWEAALRDAINALDQNKYTKVKNLDDALNWLRGQLAKPVEGESATPDIPMGVSEWKNHGIKYGYWDYWVAAERRKAKKELLVKVAIETTKYPLDDVIELLWAELEKEEDK